MTTRPLAPRSLAWLPRWLTCANPALSRTLIAAAPERTGSAGLTQGCGSWR